MRFPLARMMVANATLLSAIYLGFALAIELVRHFVGARWAEALARALDQLPMVTLGHLRLWEPLWDSYRTGYVSEFWLRVILGVTTVAIIFATAVLVGLLLWGLRSWMERLSKARA